MKKLFLTLAAIQVLCLVSCSKDPQENNPTPNPGLNNSTVHLTEAVYYGEKLGSGVGYYSMYFEKGDESLRLDLFGSVATDSSAASLGGGDYSLGSVDKPANKTFFLADAISDEIGTLYWNDGSAYLVTGGTVNVSVAPGGYRVTANLTAGDKEVNFVYNGKITFIDQYEKAPRVPIQAGYVNMGYLGEYEGNSNLGYVGMILAESAESNTYMRVNIVIPIPADLDNIEVPTGTFEIAKNPQGNQVESGYLEGNSIGGSYEVTLTNAGYLRTATMLEEGTLTITKNSDRNYTIRTDFSGTGIAPGANAVIETGRETGIVYEITFDAPSNYLDDESRPYSNLTGDIDITNSGLVKAFFDAWSMTKTELLYRLVFTSEDLDVYPGDEYDDRGTLYVSGQGSLLGIQITAPFYGSGTVPDVPTGDFPMYASYDYDYSPNVVRPSIPGDGSILGLFSGSWYIEIAPDPEEGGLIMTKFAGCTKDGGMATISSDDDALYVTITDFLDKHGYTISGSFSTNVPQISSLTATSAAAANAAPATALKISELPRGAYRPLLTF